ncbi:UNVERIFIED_CONTAM: thioesterase family protein [Streptococcus canis]|uniref:Fluoroacetyl-CoA thioesterase n=2 Tax=Streptococcus canis TaxID=1329 RepID=A0A2D4DRY8_STRCB|nr:thioesterase family protein [Streptococcus canis]MDV6023349.1 thioesterase family protein [Streptococcus canis]QKG77832.1 thioesterase family protein [Streptococcus canis]GAY71674.1 thioesterase superfamily protein [Streptococcus canis]VDC43806.1 Fluoroacetyl-CoA thioesterase [Streptococcus canis]
MTIYSHIYETKAQHSAKAMGSGTLDVLATPALVSFMENAAYLFAQESLEIGLTTVGSEMAIQHLAASAIGKAVTIVITALKEEGRKYDFRIEAFAGEQLIGKACHTRVRVDSQTFMAKLVD